MHFLHQFLITPGVSAIMKLLEKGWFFLIVLKNISSKILARWPEIFAKLTAANPRPANSSSISILVTTILTNYAMSKCLIIRMFRNLHEE